MKNNINKILALLLMVGVFSSCNKSFLDRTPYTALSPTQALSSEADLLVALRGAYAGLRNSDFFGRTVPVAGDLYADNAYVSVKNSGRYIPFNTYAITVPDGNVTGFWTAAYNTILRANNIINATPTGTANINEYKGEAYAVRALCYFYLVRYFAKPYTDNPSSPGVPIILTYDVTQQAARNTVGDVYKQILSDLDKAYTNMTMYTNSGQFSKYAAKALQAKVYLYMGDNANAKTAALDVINNSGFSLVTTSNFASYWGNGATRTDKLETLFEVSSDGINNNGFDALTNIYNQAGYGDLLCTDDLYALYTATDIRNTTWLSTGTRGGVPATFVTKYKNPNGSADPDDTKLLRLSDVYLIAAEASLPGDETSAKNYLNYVATNRDPSFTGYTSTGAQLLNDIITERRKEMAFEGDRYGDLSRLKRDINRSANYPSGVRSLPYSDTRRLFPIPQAELDPNPNMKQNPGY
ncbi:MAG: RagB/SusD family nutrient uptake outer membrane protein [Bacteroidota bacterium]|nr:RagB/SusD family nutrient uptake outer membrane protein [Bacteroidota bacterium]